MAAPKPEIEQSPKQPEPASVPKPETKPAEPAQE
jgi:hypothetical protein